MIKMGARFYDEREGRWLTVDGQGADPKCYRCIVEELNEAGDDTEVTGTQLFMDGELARMQEVE